MRLEKVMAGSNPLQNSENNKQLTAAMDRSAQRILQEKGTTNHGEEMIPKEEVETVISKLNEFVEPLQTNLKFQLHEKLNEYYVVVVNPLTDEVLKEIPPKKMLDMYAAMAEFMGILIDEKI